MILKVQTQYLLFATLTLNIKGGQTATLLLILEEAKWRE